MSGLTELENYLVLDFAKRNFFVERDKFAFISQTLAKGD
jgi:hypothetical protein